MEYFFFNGKTYEANTPIIGPDNRGLRFGDGVFETLKYKNGQLILVDEHFARLWKGLKKMQFDIPKLFTPDLLEEQVLQLVKKNQHLAARIRITIIRGDGGLYDRTSQAPQYLIQSWPLPPSNGQLNENGLAVCMYREALKMADAFSQLKHNNFLPYLLGAQYAQSQQCNEAIVLNQHQRICDATIANIFMVKGNEILTPALSEGCIAGIMRETLLQVLPTIGFDVKEVALTEETLMDADEIFLTNSIYNLRWVGNIGSKKFGQTAIRQIYQTLQQTNAAVFC
jgi:branched-chain amino acid aminotransferase